MAITSDTAFSSRCSVRPSSVVAVKDVGAERGWGVSKERTYADSVMTSTSRPCPHQRHDTESMVLAMTSGSSMDKSPPTV